MNGAKVGHKSGQDPLSAVNFTQGKSLPRFKIGMRSVSCFVPCGDSVKPVVLQREDGALLCLFYSDGPGRPKVPWGTNQIEHSTYGELWQVEIAKAVSNVMYGGYTAPAPHSALWAGACWKGDS